MRKIRTLNLENATEKEISAFEIRDTARAIIIDNENNIALMKVTRSNFHKVPGGGIDGGENAIEALHRECLEEAGVEIETPVELGMVVEIKKQQEKIQNSYCYITHIKGQKGASQLTKTEAEKAFKTLWVTIDEALRLVVNDGYSNIGGRYIQEREIAILDAAKKSDSFKL